MDFRLAKLTPSSTSRPSTWWNIGVCVTSESSDRRGPGAITASGRLSARGAQRADLHRRGVRAQQRALAVPGEIERVVHRARRMIGRDVQRVEIVEVVLDLGAVWPLEAGFAEQLLDAQPRARHRMQAAAAARRGPAA